MCSSDLHSMAFRTGHYLRQQVSCSVDHAGVLRVAFERREGDYQPWWRSITLVVHGWRGPATARFEGRAVAVEGDAGRERLQLNLPDIKNGAVEIVPAGAA